MGDYVVDASARMQILQAGIDLIKAHASTVEEIELYYWSKSNGEISMAMYTKCEELLGRRLAAGDPLPLHAYFHCLLVAVIQG